MRWKSKSYGLAEFVVVWLSLLGVLVGGAAIGQSSGPATTMITDTVYRGDGTTASGSVLVSWPAFTTAGGSSIPAGSTSVTIGAAGMLSVSLVSNAGSTPMGSYYTVVYHLNDGSVTREYWVVPTSASAVAVSSIRSTVLPASVAMQTVSKAYVDTAIALAVLGTPLDATSIYVAKAGDTMTGPLVLPGDPVASLQASDKNYVDTQIASLSSGLGQKVSLLPTGNQTVSQPVGTTLEVSNLNGVESASEFVTGSGNNGISNATASAACTSGCTVVVEPTYPSVEVANPNTWTMGTHVQDLRNGGVTNGYKDPLNPNKPGQSSAEELDLTATQSAQSIHATTGAVGIESAGVVMRLSGLTGGSNAFPQSVQGTLPYLKSNYVAEDVVGNYNTQGQHVQHAWTQNCYGVGDCLMGGMVMQSSGGTRDNADEGAHPFDWFISEDTRVLEGTCETGCTPGSTSVKLAVTANAGTQGEGRYLIDLNPAGIISAGTITGGTGAYDGRQPTVTFTGTSFPVSTQFETAVTIPTQANDMAPGTVTVAIVTSGLPLGFQANTAALAATSGVACVTDASASDGRPLNYEMGNYTTVDATHLSMTLNRAHASGATIAVGGLCGYGLEQTTDRTAGIRQVFPVVGSSSATTLQYAAGGTPVVGAAGTTGTFLTLDAPIFAIARNSNVVTVTTAANIIDVNGLSITIAGIADSSFNGTFAATTTGPQTFTYAQTGANTTSSGGTANYLNGAFALYPMAEVLGVYDTATSSVDGLMTLAPNSVNWAANDAIEQPHYFQERVAPDVEFITQYAARAAAQVQGGIWYSGNNGPGLRGWQIENLTSPSTYLGGGGTRGIPDAGFEVEGVWNTSMLLQAGNQAAFIVACNMHGCGRWDSAYDLFEMGSSVGTDGIRYAPATSDLTFNLRGTAYAFTPSGLTAGTINVGTLNATSITAGGLTGTVPAGTLPVFGPSGAGHAVGAVPDPGATAGTTRFLREDGSWNAVTTGGAVSSVNGQTGAVTVTAAGMPSACSNVDVGVCINAAIQAASLTVPSQVVLPTGTVSTQIVVDRPVTLVGAGGILTPGSGLASVPVATSASAIGASTAVTVASATGLSVGQAVGGLGLQDGSTILSMSGASLTLSLPALLKVKGQFANGSATVSSLSSTAGLAAGQSVTCNSCGAGNTIASVSLTARTVTLTNVAAVTTLSGANANIAVDDLVVTGTWSVPTLTAVTVTPVVRFVYNASAMHNSEGQMIGAGMQGVTIADYSNGGKGRSLTGVSGVQIAGFDQFYGSNNVIANLMGTCLTLGGPNVGSGTGHSGVVRESKFYFTEMRDCGDWHTGQGSLVIQTGDTAQLSDEINQIAFDNAVPTFNYGTGIVIGTLIASHTGTNGPRFVRFTGGSQVENGSHVNNGAGPNVGNPVDEVHIQRAYDVYFDNTDLSAPGFGKSVIGVDTAQVVSFMEGRLYAAGKGTTYTVTAASGSSAITYVSGGEGSFEVGGVWDGNGVMFTDSGACVAGCAGYLLNSGAVNGGGTTATLVSNVAFTPTGTLTMQIVGGGYYFGTSSGGRITSEGVAYNDPIYPTTTLLGITAAQSFLAGAGATTTCTQTDYWTWGGPAVSGSGCSANLGTLNAQNANVQGLDVVPINADANPFAQQLDGVHGAYWSTSAATSFSAFHNKSVVSTVQQDWYAGQYGSQDYKLFNSTASTNPFFVSKAAPNNELLVLANGITVAGSMTFGGISTPLTGVTSASALIVTCPAGGSSGQVCTAGGTWVTPSTSSGGTMAGQNANAVAITGGTIDGVAIGATTAVTSVNTPLVNGAAGLNLQTTSGNIVFLPNGTSRWYVGATSGNFLATTDNAVNIGASGANRPASIYAGTSITSPVFDSSATQTTVSCSTSGSVTFSEPLAGASLKRVEIHAAACVGTASYTFPAAFSFVPQVLSQSLASIVSAVSATAVTITGSTSTGFVALDGY